MKGFNRVCFVVIFKLKNVSSSIYVLWFFVHNLCIVVDSIFRYKMLRMFTI